MLEGARVAVVVPAYNEARLIGRTLAAIPPFVDRVIVVDDASEDQTAERVLEAADPRVELLRHARNQGVGAAILSGYRRAFASGADVAVVMAGDAQMDPRDLPPLLLPVIRGEVGYAKGDRLSHPEVARSMPLPRFLGNHVLSTLTRAATGLPIRDSQCGYTALARAAAERVGLERLWPRYGYPNDLLGRLAEAEVRVRDVVVRPIYGEEQSGVRVRDALVVVPYVLARVALRRLTKDRGVGDREAGGRAAQRDAGLAW